MDMEKWRTSAWKLDLRASSNDGCDDDDDDGDGDGDDDDGGGGDEEIHVDSEIRAGAVEILAGSGDGGPAELVVGG